MKVEDYSHEDFINDMNKGMRIQIKKDAIRCSDNYIVLDHSILFNNKLTSKAKIVLSILISDKNYKIKNANDLSKFMKEGVVAINNAIKELIEYGYLQRITYKRNNKFAGVFLVHTITPWKFVFNHDRLENEFGGSMFDSNLKIEWPIDWIIWLEDYHHEYDNVEDYISDYGIIDMNK